MLYHVWLWRKVRSRPHETIIGINSAGRRLWVVAMIKVNFLINVTASASALSGLDAPAGLSQDYVCDLLEKGFALNTVGNGCSTLRCRCCWKGGSNPVGKAEKTMPV
ncbi:hypothetical protein ACMD2_27070 [Ananas comosus]|uniref:Uncharacterized protein n=1 Tax=Ananas comosus TaxID=4615 RepID=A0A199V1V6_ANACO|nr:hypothetical protein ACMD2_27070 [Ananas comosus]